MKPVTIGFWVNVTRLTGISPARSGLYTQILLVYERCCFLALLLLCKDGSQPGTLSPDASESSATGYYGGDSKLSFQHAARQIPWLGWFSS
ncbi:hypothetical protein DY000_02010547 [Brassica cretica]|uniref:Secreted protein n=1 Tax=Brassica cretica TaxID=69181 RepID=A0ABQ7C8L1_BRACR|nr:hypothetical protein DY000_02010547 [Brassica cretica]